MDSIILTAYIFVIFAFLEFLFLIFLLIIKRKDIMVWLFPQNYFEYEILYPDDSIVIRVERIPADSNFTYADGIYFVEPKLGFKAGTLVKYYYDLNNPHPKDIRTRTIQENSISYNPKVLFDYQNTIISDLFTGNGQEFMNLLTNWKLYAVAGIIIVVYFVFFRSKGG